MLKTMREEGHQPNLVTYNALIHAHAKQAAGLERVRLKGKNAFAKEEKLRR